MGYATSLTAEGSLVTHIAQQSRFYTDGLLHATLSRGMACFDDGLRTEHDDA